MQASRAAGSILLSSATSNKDKQHKYDKPRANKAACNT